MKNLFECNPILYWKNKIKIYKSRRNSYKLNSNKWIKYNELYEKAQYNLRLWNNKISKCYINE